MQEHSQEQKGGGLYALRVESTAQWRCKGAGCPEHPVAVRLCSILEGRFKLAALRTIPSIPLSNGHAPPNHCLCIACVCTIVANSLLSTHCASGGST